MNLTKRLLGILGLLTMFLLASVAITQDIKTPSKDAKDAVEVQTRGPLHEAFAQPFGVTPAPGPIIPKAPPAPVPEDPPESRPDNDAAQWIPGYWAWDAERKDHLWVSGVYRVPPQNRQYVPGYWQKADDGWRWIHGFWSNPGQGDIPYTPEPPAPLDNGPTTPAPDDKSTYIPGTWVYKDSRFVWRPGYWGTIQEGRVWVPAHYVWTPNGYLFVDGYWEQPFDLRGLAFAPVYFNDPLYLNDGYRYRPSYILNLGSFFNSAFIGPGGGFYFGNLYSPFYARNGYYPWYNGRGRYDPMFAYYGAVNQRNPNWLANQQQLYADRVAGTAVAPPLGLVQQNKLVAAKKATPVVTPLNQSIGLVNLSATQAAAQQSAIQKTQNMAAIRQQLEAAGATMATPSQVRTVPFSAFTAPSSGNAPARQQTSPSGSDPKMSHNFSGNAPGGPNSNFHPGNAHLGSLPLGNPSSSPGIKILNNPPTMINNPTVPNRFPNVTNKLPNVTNTLPKGPSVTNSLPTTILPGAGVTNKPGPQIIQSYSPPAASAIRSMPAPRVTPAPAPRMTTPAPRMTTPAPRFTPAPAARPHISSTPARRR